MSEAAFLLLGAGCFCGVCAAQRLKKRERALFETYRFLHSLKLALEYSGAPLGAILQTLYEDGQFRDLFFLTALFGRLSADEPLPQAWEAAAKGERGALGDAGAALLGRLGLLLGTTDKQGQTALLERELTLLSDMCDAASQKRKRCAALYRAAGAFAGFAIFILLV